MAAENPAGEVLAALVIGCGRVGGGTAKAVESADVLSHASAYDAHSGFNLVACVEPDEECRNAFMKKWRVPAGFADLSACFTSKIEFDVASICTPTGQHETDLKGLLTTDVRAVWCEKPMTESAARSSRLVDAYAEAGKHFSVNHLRRWHPSMMRLAGELANGKWGHVQAVIGTYSKGIRNNGTHMVDLIQMMVGPLKPKFASVSRVDHNPCDPTLDAFLKTEAGAGVHLVGSDARDYTIFELEILAANGVIRIEQGGRVLRIREPADDPATPDYRLPREETVEETGTGSVFLNAVDNIYATVTRGAQLASTGRSALAAEQICDALLEMAKGK